MQTDNGVVEAMLFYLPSNGLIDSLYWHCRVDIHTDFSRIKVIKNLFTW